MAQRGAEARGGLERITVTDGLETRFGQIELAGEVRNAEPRQARRLKVHDGLVVSVVSHGSGRFVSRTGPSVPIVGPTLTVVLPREEHWYGTHPGQRWTEWFAVVNGPIFEMLIDSAPAPVRSGPRPIPAGVRIAEFAEVLQSPAPTATAEEQIWTLARWLAGALRVPSEHETPEWARVAELLTRDFQEQPALAEIATEVGMTYETFRRKFRARYGKAPLAYRNERRLEAAATLLRLTTLTCRDIADRLGFADEYHLSHRFKAKFGMSPSRYRADQV
ncbi:MAG: AraC family transcriptional regulator [Propionibacteriaceae bacterium]